MTTITKNKKEQDEIIRSILENKEGFVQIDNNNMTINNYYFIIKRNYDDNDVLYVGKLFHIYHYKNKKYNYSYYEYDFEDLHNPITQEKIIDLSLVLHEEQYIFAKLNYKYYHFIEKYNMKNN